MISEETIKQNYQLYLFKLQEKHKRDERAFTALQDLLDSSARSIQQAYRIHIIRKKTKAAIKIARFWRKASRKIRHQKEVLLQFKRRFFAGKISFAIYKHVFKRSFDPLVSKVIRYPVLSLIRKEAYKMAQMKAAISAEISYNRKVIAYDKQMFAQKWRDYEKRVTAEMWKQIGRKWVNKMGDIWLNEQDKQIDAKKYITRCLNKIYQEHYSKLEGSRDRLQANICELRATEEGIVSRYLMLLRR